MKGVASPRACAGGSNTYNDMVQARVSHLSNLRVDVRQTLADAINSICNRRTAPKDTRNPIRTQQHCSTQSLPYVAQTPHPMPFAGYEGVAIAHTAFAAQFLDHRLSLQNPQQFLLSKRALLIGDTATHHTSESVKQHTRNAGTSKQIPSGRVGSQ